MTPFITILAFLGDWIIGDPERWPHPVRIIGRLISKAENQARRLTGNDPQRLRWGGAGVALAVVFGTMAFVHLLLWLSASLWGLVWFLVAVYLVYSSLCLKDLYQQTWRVEKALRNGSLTEARQKLAMVVGRDTNKLDEAGVRRAIIETLAENFSDGLVAPMFYLALGGPVLAWGYKAINTLDSMIGYKNERYLNFGRFAAKLDDAANYIPARLASLLIVYSARLQGFNWREAWRIWRRDSHLHSSPNSGCPEAAMAGALGLWLGGSSYYGGILYEKPAINQDGAPAEPEMVKAAESIVIVAALLMLGLVLISLILLGNWGWQ